MLAQDLSNLTHPFSNFIIVDDFNAHHFSWGCPRSNTYGMKVRRWVDQNFAQILAPS